MTSGAAVLDRLVRGAIGGFAGTGTAIWWVIAYRRGRLQRSFHQAWPEHGLRPRVGFAVEQSLYAAGLAIGAALAGFLVRSPVAWGLAVAGLVVWFCVGLGHPAGTHSHAGLTPQAARLITWGAAAGALVGLATGSRLVAFCAAPALLGAFGLLQVRRARYRGSRRFTIEASVDVDADPAEILALVDDHPNRLVFDRAVEHRDVVELPNGGHACTMVFDGPEGRTASRCTIVGNLPDRRVMRIEHDEAVAVATLSCEVGAGATAVGLVIEYTYRTPLSAAARQATRRANLRANRAMLARIQASLRQGRQPADD